MVEYGAVAVGVAPERAVEAALAGSQEDEEDGVILGGSGELFVRSAENTAFGKTRRTGSVPETLASNLCF